MGVYQCATLALALFCTSLQSAHITQHNEDNANSEISSQNAEIVEGAHLSDMELAGILKQRLAEGQNIDAEQADIVVGENNDDAESDDVEEAHLSTQELAMLIRSQAHEQFSQNELQEQIDEDIDGDQAIALRLRGLLNDNAPDSDNPIFNAIHRMGNMALDELEHTDEDPDTLLEQIRQQTMYVRANLHGTTISEEEKIEESNKNNIKLGELFVETLLRERAAQDAGNNSIYDDSRQFANQEEEATEVLSILDTAAASLNGEDLNLDEHPSEDGEIQALLESMIGVDGISEHAAQKGAAHALIAIADLLPDDTEAPQDDNVAVEDDDADDVHLSDVALAAQIQEVLESAGMVIHSEFDEAITTVSDGTVDENSSTNGSNETDSQMAEHLRQLMDTRDEQHPADGEEDNNDLTEIVDAEIEALTNADVENDNETQSLSDRDIAELLETAIASNDTAGSGVIGLVDMLDDARNYSAGGSLGSSELHASDSDLATKIQAMLQQQQETHLQEEVKALNNLEKNIAQGFMGEGEVQLTEQVHDMIAKDSHIGEFSQEEIIIDDIIEAGLDELAIGIQSGEESANVTVPELAHMLESVLSEETSLSSIASNMNITNPSDLESEVKIVADIIDVAIEDTQAHKVGEAPLQHITAPDPLLIEALTRIIQDLADGEDTHDDVALVLSTMQLDLLNYTASEEQEHVRLVNEELSRRVHAAMNDLPAQRHEEQVVATELQTLVEPEEEEEHELTTEELQALLKQISEKTSSVKERLQAEANQPVAPEIVAELDEEFDEALNDIENNTDGAEEIEDNMTEAINSNNSTDLSLALALEAMIQQHEPTTTENMQEITMNRTEAEEVVLDAYVDMQHNPEFHQQMEDIAEEQVRENQLLNTDSGDDVEIETEVEIAEQVDNSIEHAEEVVSSLTEDNPEVAESSSIEDDPAVPAVEESVGNFEFHSDQPDIADVNLYHSDTAIIGDDDGNADNVEVASINVAGGDSTQFDSNDGTNIPDINLSVSDDGNSNENTDNNDNDNNSDNDESNDDNVDDYADYDYNNGNRNNGDNNRGGYGYNYDYGRPNYGRGGRYGGSNGGANYNTNRQNGYGGNLRNQGGRGGNDGGGAGGGQFDWLLGQLDDLRNQISDVKEHREHTDSQELTPNAPTDPNANSNRYELPGGCDEERVDFTHCFNYVPDPNFNTEEQDVTCLLDSYCVREQVEQIISPALLVEIFNQFKDLEEMRQRFSTEALDGSGQGGNGNSNANSGNNNNSGNRINNNMIGGGPNVAYNRNNGRNAGSNNIRNNIGGTPNYGQNNVQTNRQTGGQNNGRINNRNRYQYNYGG